MKHKLLTGFLLLAIVSSASYGQKQSKMESLFQTKQKWTVMDVKSNRPYFEVGETLSMRVDRKFYHDRNNYAKLGGSWTLDGKKLILIYDSFTEERKRIPYEYKVKKWGKNGWSLSYRNKFNKKERAYFK